MGTVNLSQIEGQGDKNLEEYVTYLANQLEMIREELQNVLEGRISSLNIREIAGYNVSQTELKHKSGIVGMSGDDPTNPDAIRFWAGDADKEAAPFRVQQNGKATLTGAQIQSVEGGYPRVEVSSTGNLIAAYLNANQYIALSPDATGGPTYIFYDGGTQKGALSYISGVGLLFQALAGSITITPQTNLFLTAWNKIFNDSGQTLQQVFNSKANNFSGSYASISVVTGINFATQTAQYALLNFENGILKSVVT